eukprot:2922550-Amphidinium_carterae.1
MTLPIGARHSEAGQLRRLLFKVGTKWSSDEEAARKKQLFEALFQPGQCASSCDEHSKMLLRLGMVSVSVMDCNFRFYIWTWEEGSSDIDIRL